MARILETVDFLRGYHKNQVVEDLQAYFWTKFHQHLVIYENSFEIWASKVTIFSKNRQNCLLSEKQCAFSGRTIKIKS